MASHTFKTSGIIRSGFEYQDLIGIDVLLRFYRDPNLFFWVEIESEDERTGKLDDVVAARKDGSFELLQVKFTPDPAEHLLDWNWLLTKKPRGRSFLKKWAESLATVRSLGPIHSAKLRTNRIPSSTFSSSLNGNFIDFSKIDAAQRNLIVLELGGETTARDFFSKFEFAHSEKLIDDLEPTLKDRIVPTDTDNTGWLILREQTRRWAIKKGYPEPDGKIRHKHLVQIITKRRPKPIPQDFDVPDLYQVPSKDFHDSVLQRIKTGTRPVSILWGTPGRGKSTYLSYLVDLLGNNALPVIRHHYFLSLDDSTADRISFAEICSSLMDQMSSQHPDAIRGQEESQNQLRKWLEACGAYYAKANKRFCIVIDGLDHVWREQRNTEQMEHLFNYLLPCPENVSLLIGTQRVSSEQLPLRLIQHSIDGDWIEIPPMGDSSVHAWIKGQHDANRLLLRTQQYSEDAELSAVSRAFFDISNGHPLHLIYSFEALVRRGAIVTAEEVRLLPSCPDGDIRKYYASLWGRLPAEGKKVIHLVAGSDFHWPVDGLRNCAGTLDEVDHLLEHRRTGVIPFHGSILAYARDQSDHIGTFGAVLPAVVRWLEFEAPEYWRWAWLWIMRARAGDNDELLTSTTRDWVIASLTEGWPASQIVHILSMAEDYAFGDRNYARTIELRSLRIRVQNGQSFQVDRFNDFEECAIRASRNAQQILNKADMILSASDSEIITTLRCLNGKENDGIGRECYEELRRQINTLISLRHRRDEEFISLAESFLEALVDFGKPDFTNILRFIRRFHARDRLFQTLLRNIVRARNFDLALALLGLLQEVDSQVWRNSTQNAIVRIAGAEGIDLSSRLPRQSSVSPLLACWYRVTKKSKSGLCNLVDLSSDAIRERYDYGPNADVERFFHALFFASLETALQADGECSLALAGIDRSGPGWISEACQQVWSAAFAISEQPSEIHFGAIFVGLSDLEPVNTPHRPSEAPSAQYRALSSAMRQIAADLHALKCAIEEPHPVAREDFELARASTHWIDSDWIASELQGRTMIFEPLSIQALIDELEQIEAIHVTRFSERGERWIDLAQLSILYHHDGAQRFVSRAADCIIGYGWRKDVWIFDVLSAIEAIRELGAADVLPWIDVLAPIIDQITTFTDGDETNHAPEEFINLIAKAKPSWLPDLYEYYVFNEEWRLAERTLAGILSQVDFSDSAGAALARSLLDNNDLQELEKLDEGQASNIKELLKTQRKFIGQESSRVAIGNHRSKKSRSDRQDELGRRGRPPDVTKFGPDQLEPLLKRVGRNALGYLHRQDALLNWLKHWDAAGKGLEALGAIDTYFTAQENPHDIEPLLDEAFNVSLKYEGKKRAYVWLVRAHVERSGWSGHWDSNDLIKRRLELAAKHYAGRWAEYISETSKPSRYWERRRNGFTIGTHWLVRYLLLVGQKELAVQYTDAMVHLTKDELNDQPLTSAGWLQ